jgi:hypothetical protein
MLFIHGQARWSTAFFIWLLIAMPSVAFAASEQDTPISPVRTFCDYDSNGARLSSHGYSSIPDVVILEPEPGWDTMVIISKLKIGMPEKTSKGFRVIVQFTVLGFLDGWAWTSAKDKNVKARVAEQSMATFEVIKVNGKWRVRSPGYPPHVAHTVALKYCRSMKAYYDNHPASNDYGEKPLVEATIRALEKLNGKKNK